jgi:hypothetical protein
MAMEDYLRRAREKAERAMKLAEAEHRRALLKRRIELAQRGVEAFKQGKISEAVLSFQAYLKILEDWKGVPAGGLTPSHFDVKKDIPELLVISGVYWDLTKLFDRTRNRQSEFHHYMGKYLLFSKGMPFQPLAAETLRKYVNNDKPVHGDDFKNTYKQMTGNSISCFVATSLIDVCDFETLPRLRVFRDEVLERSFAGRAFVRGYYVVGPWIAATLDRMPECIRVQAAKIIDHLAERV